MSYLSEWRMEIQAPEFHNDEERWIKNNNSDQLKKTLRFCISLTCNVSNTSGKRGLSQYGILSSLKKAEFYVNKYINEIKNREKGPVYNT